MLANVSTVSHFSILYFVNSAAPQQDGLSMRLYFLFAVFAVLATVAFAYVFKF